MKATCLTLFFVFFMFSALAQEMYLIEETDSIQIFETYLSNTSTGNVFPTFYKNGLLYVSKNKSNEYQLFYSNLKSESVKIALGSKFDFGAATVYNSEIYFTGISKSSDDRGYFNSTIYKGILEDFKVTKIKKMKFCDRNFSYTDPSISANGKQMVVVSTEKNIPHIIEFEKNNTDEWVKKSIVYISHPNFDIINPTIYNENTIYFSSNFLNGKITGVSYETNENGEIVVSKINREEGDFNIYKIVRSNNIWGIPIKVNEFNSEFDDLGVLFDTDKSGYLTSFRYNANDNIYYFVLKQ